MSNLWYFVVVLACPLMMIFMMRGMGGMGGSGHKMDHNQHPEGGRPEEPRDDAAEARLAELERQVAILRAERDRNDSSRR